MTSSVKILNVDVPINIHAVAGFTAGFVSSSVLYPLEIVKSRFQVGTHGNFSYKSTFSALSTIYKNSGIRELYRGFPAGLVGSSFSWGIYFYLYNHCKVVLSEFRGVAVPGPIEHWSSSLLASLAVQTLLCPLWVIKLNQQLGQSGSFFTSGFQLYKSEGVSGLYRGLIPSYWTCSHLAIQFVIYERLLAESTDPAQVVAATVVSKSVATIITSPIEVVKVSLRSNTVSVSSTARSIMTDIYKAEGFRGFYRGVSTALIRILPGQCLTFLVYEQVKLLL